MEQLDSVHGHGTSSVGALLMLSWRQTVAVEETCASPHRTQGGLLTPAVQSSAGHNLTSSLPIALSDSSSLQVGREEKGGSGEIPSKIMKGCLAKLSAKSPERDLRLAVWQGTAVSCFPKDLQANSPPS